MKWWRMFADLYIIGDRDHKNRMDHPYVDMLASVMVPCYEEWPWTRLPPYVNDNQPTTWWS